MNGLPTPEQLELLLGGSLAEALRSRGKNWNSRGEKCGSCIL
jgi:hypothetical protein